MNTRGDYKRISLLHSVGDDDFAVLFSVPHMLQNKFIWNLSLSFQTK
jgi:hypothetical protein